MLPFKLCIKNVVLGLFLCSTYFPNLTFAQSPPSTSSTTTELVNECMVVTRGPLTASSTSSEKLDAMHCAGYLRGFADSHEAVAEMLGLSIRSAPVKLFCARKISTKTLADEFVSYALANRQVTNSQMAVAAAFMRAFPCAK